MLSQAELVLLLSLLVVALVGSAIFLASLPHSSLHRSGCWCGWRSHSWGAPRPAWFTASAASRFTIRETLADA